jgi:CHAD domain-containing protein
VVEQNPQLSQAQHVRDVAIVLFERTQPLHDLGDNSRYVLERAALLQALPIPQCKKKPLKAIRELILQHVPEELTPEARKVLTAVVAYQHNRIRKKDFGRLDLSPIQQREALTIAAILKIAAGLNQKGSNQTTIKQVEGGHEEMWIVVEGPEAEADAITGQANASLWEKIGYPKIKIWGPEEAAVQLMPSPEPTEKIGIQEGDTLAEGGRKVMLYHFAQMLSHEAGTRLGENIEALHDMRVATRRLRAAFDVFGEAFEPEALKSHLKGLRATGRALGAVRDLDVFMEKAGNYLGTLPEDRRQNMNILLQAWQGQREAARAQMLAHLDSQEYLTFKRKFNIFLHTPGAGVRSLPENAPIPDRVFELAPVLIYTRLAAVRAFAPWLGNAPIELLHTLRIEFKKLRYTVEYFREVLGDEAKAVIDELKSLQDHLGDLNDAQVASNIIRAFIDDWEPRQAMLPIHERQNLEEVVNYLAFRLAERHHLMVTFAKAWKRFSRAEFRRNLARAVGVL